MPGPPSITEVTLMETMKAAARFGGGARVAMGLFWTDAEGHQPLPAKTENMPIIRHEERIYLLVLRILERS
jgi:hypothetical protein